MSAISRRTEFSSMRRWWAWLACALVGLIMAGCQASQAGIVVHLVPQHPLQVPEGSYGARAWAPNDRVVLEYSPRGEQEPGSRLWIMQSDGGDFHELELPADIQNDCSSTYYHSPVALFDGRVAYIRSCHMQQGTVFWSSAILALNAQDATSHELFNYQIPEPASFSIAFGSDPTRGVGATYSDIEHHMFGIDSRSVYSLELGLLRPNRPAWSPDGTHLAIFGNQTMRGEPGTFWATQSYDLWIMSTDCVARSYDCTDKVRLLVQDVNSPTDVSWSPDGQWLVFDGDVQSRGDGIWLLHVNSGDIFQIASGNYTYPEWSPDGLSVMIAVGSPEQDGIPGYTCYCSLALLNVSEIVGDPAK